MLILVHQFELIPKLTGFVSQRQAAARDQPGQPALVRKVNGGTGRRMEGEELGSCQGPPLCHHPAGGHTLVSQSAA
jgi:hypothetical protein